MSALDDFNSERKLRYAEELVDRYDLRVTVDALTDRLRRTPSRASLRRALATYPPKVVLKRMLLDCDSWDERDDVRETIRERDELEQQLDDRAVTEAALRDAKDRLAADKPFTKAELKVIASYNAHVFTWQPPPPNVPTIEEPGPAKVEVLERRAASLKGLWLAGQDAELSTDDGVEYDPVHADGNFALVGRTVRAPKSPLPRRGTR